MSHPNVRDLYRRTPWIHYASMCRTIMTKAAKFMLYTDKLSNTSTPSQIMYGELFMK